MGCLASYREIDKFKLELNKIKIILPSFIGTITSAIMSLREMMLYSLVLKTLLRHNICNIGH